MLTRKLYDEDAYLREFEAEVLSCWENGAGGYIVMLDATCFYPEGGGQPADHGWLEDIEVVDVHEKDNCVQHLCSAAIEPGSRIRGRIDWDRRFSYMQQHSGEHIFSGLLCERFGYDNIGFHMGKDFITVDFSGKLTEEDIADIECRSNEVIFSNREISAEYPDAEALEKLPYRSKKALEGAVRIVTVPGADICACCGTHVRYTGEIGPVKVTAAEHYKEGIRLTLRIGWKALRDYDHKHENIRRISNILSIPPEETAEGVHKQQETILLLKEENNKLKERLFMYLAESITAEEEKAILFEENLNSVEVRKLADMLMKKVGLAAVFSGNDRQGYKYVIAGMEVDVLSIAVEFNRKLNGKGGGKNPMIQGSLQAQEKEIREFFRDIVIYS